MSRGLRVSPEQARRLGLEVPKAPRRFDPDAREREFIGYLRYEALRLREPWLVEACAPQWRFSSRLFRFDFAWPWFFVALEVQGLVRGGRGGHQTIQGLRADYEKNRLAQLAGWVVLPYPQDELAKAAAEVSAELLRRRYV